MSNPTRVILLDRDGVIVRDTGYICSIAELELLPRVPEALIMLREAGYLLIVATNQSGIACGKPSLQEYYRIAGEVERMLERHGARLDAQYFCPHHPEKGEPPYLRSCECRKPKPGMLLRALREWNADPAQSWMIGDNERDIEAGRSAGVKSLFIGDLPGTLSFGDLYDAAMHILAQDKESR